MFISVIDANLVYHKDKDNQKAIQPVGPQSPDAPMLPAGPTSPEAPITPVGPTKPGWFPPQGPVTYREGWISIIHKSDPCTVPLYIFSKQSIIRFL